MALLLLLAGLCAGLHRRAERSNGTKQTGKKTCVCKQCHSPDGYGTFTEGQGVGYISNGGTSEFDVNPVLNDLMEYYRMGYGTMGAARDEADHYLTTIAERQAMDTLDQTMSNQQLRQKIRARLYTMIYRLRRQHMLQKQFEWERQREMQRLDYQKDNLDHYERVIKSLYGDDAKKPLKEQLNTVLEKIKKYQETKHNGEAIAWLEKAVSALDTKPGSKAPAIQDDAP